MNCTALKRGPFIYSFIQKIYIEYVFCAKHHLDKTEKMCVLVKLGQLFLIPHIKKTT